MYFLSFQNGISCLIFRDQFVFFANEPHARSASVRRILPSKDYLIFILLLLVSFINLYLLYIQQRMISCARNNYIVVFCTFKLIPVYCRFFKYKSLLFFCSTAILVALLYYKFTISLYQNKIIHSKTCHLSNNGSI